MSVQRVTLHLPEAVMQRAKQVADALQRPLEETLTAILAATLPDIEDVPLDMRTDLVRMTWLSDQELWAIARSAMTEDHQGRLRHLTNLRTQRSLTQEEQEALDALRQEYGRVTLRKARAYALLSLRGGRLLLADG